MSKILIIGDDPRPRMLALAAAMGVPVLEQRPPDPLLASGLTIEKMQACAEKLKANVMPENYDDYRDAFDCGITNCTTTPPKPMKPTVSPKQWGTRRARR